MTVAIASQGKDARRPGWFWADNTLIDVYAPRIGAHGIAVYMMLVRHLNGDGACWPSMATIARTLGISRRKVVDCIKRLQDEGLIDVENREADKKGTISNLYTIHRVGTPPPVQEMHTPPVQEMHRGTDNDQIRVQDAALSVPCAGDAQGGVQEMHTPYARDAQAPVQEMHTNKTKVNNTQLTTPTTIPPPAPALKLIPGGRSGGGGGDERMESDDDENLPEDSHEVEADIVHLKADLIDALVRAGVRREEAHKAVTAGTVKSDRDVVACKRYLESSGADSPGAVLWSKYLKVGDVPPIPQLTDTDPGVIEAARRLSADLDRQREQGGGPMIDQRALAALKARQAGGVLKTMPAKKPAFEWVQP